MTKEALLNSKQNPQVWVLLIWEHTLWYQIADKVKYILAVARVLAATENAGNPP